MKKGQIEPDRKTRGDIETKDQKEAKFRWPIYSAIAILLVALFLYSIGYYTGSLILFFVFISVIFEIFLIYVLGKTQISTVWFSWKSITVRSAGPVAIFVLLYFVAFNGIKDSLKDEVDHRSRIAELERQLSLVMTTVGSFFSERTFEVAFYCSLDDDRIGEQGAGIPLAARFQGTRPSSLDSDRLAEASFVDGALRPIQEDQNTYFITLPIPPRSAIDSVEDFQSENFYVSERFSLHFIPEDQIQPLLTVSFDDHRPLIRVVFAGQEQYNRLFNEVGLCAT